MAALIAKRRDCFSHPLPLSTGPIRRIRPIRPVCPRGFPPAHLPFAEGLFLPGIIVGQVGLVRFVRFVPAVFPGTPAFRGFSGKDNGARAFFFPRTPIFFRDCYYLPEWGSWGGMAMVLQWLTFIAKQGDWFSHPHPLSTGPIRPIRLICPIRPICPRGFPPAPLPFAEEQLFPVVGLVGQVGQVGLVGFV